MLKSSANKVKRKNNSERYKHQELVLPHSKIRFCSEQLRNLNFIFKKRLQHDESQTDKQVLLAKSVTERLVQRLICGVGMLDKRFASKYLISLNENEYRRQDCLKYYLRLDALSTPTLYATDNTPLYSIEEPDDEESPPGHARIRLNSSTYKLWNEFTNNSGYLRRDKIQAKFVNLLAQVAASDKTMSPSHIDESFLCASPGKIVDPFTLHRILKIPADNQVFYGSGGSEPRFPDTRDFRLAIVDEQNGIRLRVEFLSPALSALSINVRILLVITVDAWSAATNFPFRVPLGHSDYLLYHRAAQTGMYLVGFGVQTSAWQIRFPAAETVLLDHYNPISTVRSIVKVLKNILIDIQNDYLRRSHENYNVLNFHILRNNLFCQLEEDTSSLSTTLLNWSSINLSTHVLKIVDNLIAALRNQNLSDYFFSNVNILANKGHLCEDDYLVEASKLQTYLVRLFDESLIPTKENVEFKKMVSIEDMEIFLLRKWNDLVEGLLPPVSTRGRRFCFNASRNSRDGVYAQYTLHQLNYIELLLKNMLQVKQSVLQTKWQWQEEIPSQKDHLDTTEDIIYILATILEQARDQYLSNIVETNKNMKTKQKLKQHYDESMIKLLELVRKDKELLNSNIFEDDVLVKIILKWLYRGMDHNRKFMAPILRPYLNSLFNTSYIISWHIDAMKEDSKLEEMQSIGIYSNLVNCKRLTPAEGLVDGVNKNWTWAKHILKMLETTDLRLIFIPERGKVYRHILSLPKPKVVSNANYEVNKIEKAKCSTLPARSFLSTLLGKSENTDKIKPHHIILKYESPMTAIIRTFHRYGDHRCGGDVIRSLLAMQKLNVAQDISHFLSREEKFELLDGIQKMQKEKHIRKFNKKWSNTLPQTSKYRTLCTIGTGDVQRYIPKEESAGVVEDFKIYNYNQTVTFNENALLKRMEQSSGTLIGSCRAARIREDNDNIFSLQERFKKNSLVRSQENNKKKK